MQFSVLSLSYNSKCIDNGSCSQWVSVLNDTILPVAALKNFMKQYYVQNTQFVYISFRFMDGRLMEGNGNI